jgi:hypothetical protein
MPPATVAPRAPLPVMSAPTCQIEIYNGSKRTEVTLPRPADEK